MNQNKKLYRSRKNRMLGGVCGGLGEFFGIDPTIVRLLFIFAVLVSWVAPAVIIYIVMMFVVPEEPEFGVQPGRTPPGATVEEATQGEVGTTTVRGAQIYDAEPGEVPGE